MKRKGKQAPQSSFAFARNEKSNLKQLCDPDVQLTTPELLLLCYGKRPAIFEYMTQRMPNEDNFWGENWKWLRDMHIDRLRQMLPYHMGWSSQPWTAKEVEIARVRLSEREDCWDDSQAD